MYELTGSKAKQLQWTPDHRAAFDCLKGALSSAPCLAYPTRTDEFILDTDAWDYSTIDAELIQLQEGKECTIAYASQVLLPAQREYCTTRKELLAVVKFCRHFRHYLLGRRFTIRTDHNSLAWLFRFRHIEGQLSRWLEELSQFDMQIVHRSGNRHSNADGLSRIPDKLKPWDGYHAGAHLKSLPCGGCSYCSRACQQLERFSEDVDNVVPLAIKTPEPPGDVAAILITDKAIPTGDLHCEVNWAETRPRGELS